MLPTLDRDGLSLRPWRTDDAAELHREVQDPETVRWMAIDIPYELGDAEGFIAGTARAWEDGEAAHFVIADSEDRLVGYLGVLAVEDRMRVVEVGYWVAAAERGKGIATRALSMALDWVEETIEPERIELGMLAGNDASKTVAERNGFSFDRSQPSGKKIDGSLVDEWIFVR